MTSLSSLSNGLLTDSTIYNGIWINWSQGYVRGATLTTTTSGGAILVAFLALFVQFTGSQLWGISRFIIHQIRVSNKSRDALYHQQQVILRNSSPADAARGFTQVGWGWRSRANNPTRRSLPIALVALAHSITFLLAAILSSTAYTSQSDEVLVSSPHCGLMNYNTTDISAVLNILNAYRVETLTDSASYARSCYSFEGTSRTWQDCSTFAAPRLPTTQSNASCQFKEGTCTAPSIQLDTGLMDSNLFFGMNAPPTDRVKIRKVTTCAPIEVDPFSVVKQGSSQGSEYTVTTSLPELEFEELYYGPSTIIGTHGTSTRNYTYSHHTFLLNFTYEDQYQFSDIFDYDLFAQLFLTSGPPDSNSFTPISQLNREDADVTLAFLSANSIPFSSPVDDPWYSAHLNPFQALVNASVLGDSSGTAETGTIYFRDRPISVLGCTEQYQLCAPNSSPECTPLTGLLVLEEAIEDLSLNDAQQATAEVLLACITTTLQDLIVNLGVSVLTARDSKTNDVQGFLPPDQWALEAQNWNQIILANMQRSVLEYATGPSNPQVLPLLLPPNGSSQAHLCNNQKARSGRAQNFSVLAIGLIIGLGLLIIGVNVGLHRLVSYVQRERDLKDYRRLAWKSNGLLQLQRLAHEEVGFGTWERCAKSVPVTAKGEVLATLDVTDPKHPVFLRPMVPPMHPSQPSSQTPLIRVGSHVNSPQMQITTSSTAPSAEMEPKSTIAVHTTGNLTPSSSANSTEAPTNTITTQTESTPERDPSSSANSTEAPNNTITTQTESTPERDLQRLRSRRRSV